MLLVIRASAEPRPTIGELAEQLFIRHHSAVGLVDRLEERGLVNVPGRMKTAPCPVAAYHGR